MIWLRCKQCGKMRNRDWMTRYERKYFCDKKCLYVYRGVRYPGVPEHDYNDAEAGR